MNMVRSGVLIAFTFELDGNVLTRVWPDGRRETVTWIPTEANPTKLVLHVWRNRKWARTAYCKFVEVIEDAA